MLSDIIQRLIILNMSLQNRTASQKYMLGDGYYARAIQTIKLDIGRFSGKTTAICELVQNDDLVITLSPHLAWEIKNNLLHPSSVTVTTSANFYRDDCHVIKGKKFKRIWIDNASCISKDALDAIYDNTILCEPIQYILLG